MVKYPLRLLAVVMLAYGIWLHDWRLILASGAVAAIWPLISADIESARHDELLDELWADEVPSLGEIERSTIGNRY